MVHNDMSAYIIVCGTFLCDLSELGPGNGIVHCTGIQISHIYAALGEIIFIVVESYGRLCRADRVQGTVICILRNCRIYKIRKILFCEIIIKGNRDSVRRIVGNLRSVYIEDVRKIVGCNCCSDLIVICIGIGTVNGLTAHLDIRIRLIPLSDLLFPPCFDGCGICRTPDSQLNRIVCHYRNCGCRCRKGNCQRHCHADCFFHVFFLLYFGYFPRAPGNI